MYRRRPEWRGSVAARWQRRCGAAGSSAEVRVGLTDTHDAPLQGAQHFPPTHHVGVDRATASNLVGIEELLVAADAGCLVTLSNAAAITLTVPQDSAATIATGQTSHPVCD